MTWCSASSPHPFYVHWPLLNDKPRETQVSVFKEIDIFSAFTVLLFFFPFSFLMAHFYGWTSAFTLQTVRKCVWPRTSPIWKQLLAARALRHPPCLSLLAKRNASPSPFFFLFLSLVPSVSFLLPLSFHTSLSLSFSLCGLNYFRMSPNKGARWTLLHPPFFYWEQNPHHILIQITHFQFVQTSPENTSTN